MHNNLELDKAVRRGITHGQRMSFMIKLKKVLQDLEEPKFVALCRECLHRNHFPALEDYLYYTDQVVTETRKAERKRAEYMTKMFRKTLTCVLTDLTPEGYSPFILEWLILNKLWK